jgi:hypothetical protein
MPIEIKELHIKINVSEGGKSQGGGAESGANSTDATQQAVEEVMDLLRQQKER